MLQNYELECFPNMNDLTLVSCGDQVVYHSRVLAQPRAFNCRLNPFSLEAFLVESVFHPRELIIRSLKDYILNQPEEQHFYNFKIVCILVTV